MSGGRPSDGWTVLWSIVLFRYKSCCAEPVLYSPECLPWICSVRRDDIPVERIHGTPASEQLKVAFRPDFWLRFGAMNISTLSSPVFSFIPVAVFSPRFR